MAVQASLSSRGTGAMAAPAVKSQAYRQNQIVSLVVSPLLMGIGHMAPAIGAAYVVMGFWYFDWPVLVAISTLSAWMDAYDKYRDIEKPYRPSALTTASCLVPFLGMTLIATIALGVDTAIRLHRWQIFGFVYAMPLVPTWSFKSGQVRFVKPKIVFALAKSASVALVMANVSSDIAARHACIANGNNCRLFSEGPKAGDELYWKSFAIAFLYHWVRETMCDVRDIQEDLAEGVPTLPATVGPKVTLMLIANAIFVTEQLVMTGGLFMYPGWETIARGLITFVGCLIMSDKPRENSLAWGTVALVGLLPALWAQSKL